MRDGRMTNGWLMLTGYDSEQRVETIVSKLKWKPSHIFTSKVWHHMKNKTLVRKLK
jgi:hypothetical protein